MSAAAPLPAGMVTFTTTDIEGSTRLFRELGERYVELLGDQAAVGEPDLDVPEPDRRAGHADRRVLAEAEKVLAASG